MKRSGVLVVWPDEERGVYICAAAIMERPEDGAPVVVRIREVCTASEDNELGVVFPFALNLAAEQVAADLAERRRASEVNARRAELGLRPMGGADVSGN